MWSVFMTALHSKSKSRASRPTTCHPPTQRPKRPSQTHHQRDWQSPTQEDLNHHNAPPSHPLPRRTPILNNLSKAPAPPPLRRRRRCHRHLLLLLRLRRIHQLLRPPIRRLLRRVPRPPHSNLPGPRLPATDARQQAATTTTTSETCMSTDCVDYVNECGVRYGGCYEACTGFTTPSFAVPGCATAVVTPTGTVTVLGYGRVVREVAGGA